MVKLKKCPFCGSDAELITDRAEMSVVRCVNMGCKCSTRICGSKDLAVYKWNTRVEEGE